MLEGLPGCQVPSEGARALLEEPRVNAGERRCPVCCTLLRTRQRACSGKCRAELSRRRYAEVRRVREQRIRDLLRAALALMGDPALRGGLGPRGLVGPAPGTERLADEPAEVVERPATGQPLVDPREEGGARERGAPLASGARPSAAGAARSGTGR